MFGFQSGYTLLNNAIHLEQLLLKLKHSSYDFLAYADDNLYAMHRVYKAFEKSNKKVVVGLAVNLLIDHERYPIMIYPMNDKGYHNLLKIAYLSNQEKSLSSDDFHQYKEGILMVINIREGSFKVLFEQKEMNQLESLINQFLIDFSDVYLGIDLLNLNRDDLDAIKSLIKQTKVLAVPFHLTKYLHADDRIIYETLLKIKGTAIDSKSQHPFLEQEELLKLWENEQDIYHQLNKVKKKFNYTYQMPNFHMPNPPTIHKAPSNIFLKELSEAGLKKRMHVNQVKQRDVYEKRLNDELDVIISMGFSEYFLIVYDFVKYAKTHNIMVGPGRGSAAGSLVSYCLGITNIDPIKYGLLFERFLNKDRISMPDIDLDFPDHKREAVIEYVRKTYQNEHVASIQTFQTFAIKSSIRDVVKVINLDPSRIEGIISSVLSGQIDPSDHDVVLLNDIVRKLDGLPRQTGTHAAGIILAKENLSDSIPLQNGQFGFPQTQYDLNDLKALGLLKIDFLGIKNLSMIEDMIDLIRIKDEKFSLQDIILDDDKTFELLKNADTDGVFQLESSGIKQVLKKIKPHHFEDLVAVLALYRPGPMASIDLYVKQKAAGHIESMDPLIDHILKPTYGIIVYQEQIMQIANVFAGYTLSEADLLRRGVSEKNIDILKEQEAKFIEKALSMGRNYDKAKTIYALILRFADYGFNRSHSVSYGLIAYQMAYLKANYFLEFMSVLLTSNAGNEKQTLVYLQALKRKNLTIINPDILSSSHTYQIHSNALIMPLNVIKGISVATATKLIDARNAFDFKNFIKFRIQISEYINEKQFEALVHADALSCFNLSHQTMLAYKDVKTIGFDAYIADFEMMQLEEFSVFELAKNEKMVLGFNNKYDLLSEAKRYLSKKFDTFDCENDVLNVVCFLETIKVIKTKNQEEMAFVTLNDHISSIDVTVFPPQYQKYRAILKPDIFEVKIKRSQYRKSVSFELLFIKQIKI